MGLTLVTAPALEPITVAEAARHLRLSEPATEPRPGAPSVALAAAGAGNVDNGAHRWRVTFVTADGETDGGDVSESIMVVDKAVNGQVTVSDIPIGGSAVTSRKLYRTAAGGSTYLLVATIADNTTTAYTDNVADASLGVGAPSTNTTDDPYVRDLIKGAREFVEGDTERSLITQTWQYTLDGFPSDSEVIQLPRPPLQSVTSVTYLDGNGVLQTLATTEYLVDTGSLYGVIALKYGKSWPTTYAQRNAVTIRFKAGYGDATSDVPSDLRAALKLQMEEMRATSAEQQMDVTRRRRIGNLLSRYRLLQVA